MCVLFIALQFGGGGVGGGWRSCHFNLEVKIFHHFHDLYWQNFLFSWTKLLLITKVMTEILALTCCVLRWICHQSPKWCMTNSTKIVPTRLVFLTTNDSSHLAGLEKQNQTAVWITIIHLQAKCVFWCGAFSFSSVVPQNNQSHLSLPLRSVTFHNSW